MKNVASALLTVWLAATVAAQPPAPAPAPAPAPVVPTLTIPAEVKAQPGQWVVVSPQTDCKSVTYVGLDGLSAFPSSELKDSRRLVVNASAAGRYRFVAVGTLNDEAAVVSFVIVVGDVPPTPTPTPGPGPGPTPDPDPFGARDPFAPAGLKVLMVYESADTSKLPTSQLAAMTGDVVTGYLNSHCLKGPDGRTPEWRVWDKDVNTANVSPMWQKVMTRKRGNLPWIVIGNGTAGYEGPLPMTVDATLALLRKYGGN